MTASPATGVGSTAIAPSSQVPWRRLSAGMLLVEPARELIRFIPMLLVLVVAGSGGDGGHPWGLIGTGAVVALGITRYLSTRYRITPAVVELRRGILQRRHLMVPRDRIRTMDVSAHPLQRLLRLVRVDIGTGSSHAHAPTVRLDGLPASTVAALRGELLHHATGPPAGPLPAWALPAGAPDHPLAVTEPVDRGKVGHRPADPGEIELARFRPRWIALAPATLSGVLTGAVLIGFGFRLMREARLNPAEFGPVQHVVGYLREHSVWLDVGFAAAAVVLAVALLSVVGYVLSFWGFRLSHHPGGTLQVSRGLLTTRSTSIAERRMRGVQRREPLVLRWARGARLHAVATGLRAPGGAGGDGAGSVLMPPAPAGEVRRVEAAVLGDERLVHTALTPHGAAARRRRYTRALAGNAVVAAGLVAFTWWAVLSAPLYPAWVAIALAGALPLAADRYRNLGHAVVDRHLVVRLGSLHRRRTVLAVDAVIGVTIRQSLFQRRSRLATVVATTAAGAQHYDIPDLADPVAIDLARTLVPEYAALVVHQPPDGRRHQARPAANSGPNRQGGQRVTASSGSALLR